jgi:glycosyltransferase involved in cell wall biosynthesis
MGEIYPGYKKNAHADEVINGVTVHRCNINPRKTGALHRIWNYYSYSFKSKKYIKKLDDSFDVVFINQLSPVMMAKAGIAYAKKHGKKSVLYCLDLWPASIGVGGISGGIIYKWFYKESKKIYSSVDKILATSKSFAEYFDIQFGIKNVKYLPQYAEDSFSPDACKKTPDEFIDLMFAGNIGAAQCVDKIIYAADKCKDISNLRWHIVGDGKEYENCRALAVSLNAPVTFHGRKPLEEMPVYYSMADAMLVTLKKDAVIGLTLPGKVQSYMAAGKFVISTDYGETAAVIKECDCGLCCDTEDPDSFSECVRNFAVMNSEIKRQKEANANLAYSTRFDKSKFMEKLMLELE